MKQPWWALLIVAVLGAGIGVGSAALVGNDTADSANSAGAPTASPDDGSATTTAPAATTSDATNGTTDTTAATSSTATTTESTTADDPSTTEPATTEPDDTEPATTEPGGGEPDVAQPPIEDLVIVIANGASGGGATGLAGTTADVVRFAGYPNVTITTGTQPFGGTVIYVADGLQPAAERLVADIQFFEPGFASPAFIVPLDNVPATEPPFGDADIVVYLGQDQV